ncbi:histidine-type phosphatase [Cetobacterium sp. 2A]|uniref:histidine-type phosphatase n=1 Tax=Cetobacterium sp. 2A TaxID=2754723 RepID=UPI00163BB7FF|nr:histidine-type phosphatase [Cetobacterium sp. 2A]MBC2855159.1 histidine-type phosphatase [Cetobacterium sp. 2A]
MKRIMIWFFLSVNLIFSKDKKMEINTYLGTQTPYVKVKREYTPPPPGYVPIYINHIGRHGARYLSTSKDIDYVINIFEDANKKQSLTEDGKIIRKYIINIANYEKEKFGLLTPLGKEMEKGIAKRMYENFPEVFGKEVIAVSTYVERTKESMNSFLEELSKYTSSNFFKSSSYGKIDPILRFFSLNKAYLEYKEKGDWKKELQNFENKEDFSTDFLKKFFSESYLKEIHEKNKFSQILYEIYGNQFDIKKNFGLGDFFTEKELKILWENENLSQYLEKGPGNIGNEISTNVSVILLKDFLVTSEAALLNRKTSANLRFAHAETIIPFASILKIKGASEQTDDLIEVKNIWKDYEIAPMGANIQWIFYEHNNENPILVKMLYNEKEIEFPIESQQKPYYKWEDIKKFYSEIVYFLLTPNFSK